jgi:hypothetical protein
VEVPEGPGCQKCYIKKDTYPLLSFAAWTALYKSNEQVRTESDEALRRHESNDVSDVPQSAALGVSNAGIRVLAEYLIFSEKEFLEYFKVPYDKMGCKLEKIWNERDMEEEVVILRDKTKPRRAVVYAEHQNCLQEPLLMRALRQGQSRDAWAKGNELMGKSSTAAAMPSGSRRLKKLMNVQDVTKKVRCVCACVISPSSQCRNAKTEHTDHSFVSLRCVSVVCIIDSCPRVAGFTDCHPGGAALWVSPCFGICFCCSWVCPLFCFGCMPRC